jgi:transcription antitermination protein NusB
MPQPSLNSTRRTARERALELLYEADIKNLSVEQVLAALPVPPDEYATRLARGVSEHQLELDELIAGFLRTGWSMDRIPTIDRLILQLGTEELHWHHDVPVAVVLDESVRLAKGFSTDESGRFVNGLLASVARRVRTGAVDQTVPQASEPESDGPRFDVTVQSAQDLDKHGSLPVGVSLEDEPATALDS